MKGKLKTTKAVPEEETGRFTPAWMKMEFLAKARRTAGVSPAHVPTLFPARPANKPEYDATIGQLVCPYCDGDCGGWCEAGDRKYASED